MGILIVKEADMSIKKIITGLTLSLLLSSGTANAGWGDVYYCQMTNFGEITLEGEKKPEATKVSIQIRPKKEIYGVWKRWFL